MMARLPEMKSFCTSTTTSAELGRATCSSAKYTVVAKCVVLLLQNCLGCLLDPLRPAEDELLLGEAAAGAHVENAEELVHLGRLHSRHNIVFSLIFA